MAVTPILHRANGLFKRKELAQQLRPLAVRANCVIFKKGKFNVG